ncbi:MAG: hypothetical protein GXO83_02230 [Chlorobi bacterium]|nr:hypothetical protein [Chlorobiota bacterium]
MIPFALLCAVTFTSCRKIDLTPLLKVATDSVADIGFTSCTLQGILLDPGAKNISNIGFFWGPNADFEKGSFVENVSVGSVKKGTRFVAQIQGLTPATTYFVTAYASADIEQVVGNTISFTTLDNHGTVVDIDGNSYQTVIIGSQEWMSENLRTTKFNNGTEIPYISNDTVWNNLQSPGFSIYNHDSTTYRIPYGALYNWYTVNSGNLCPAGWHVPSSAEWQVLVDAAGGNSVAGSNLKETGTAHWSEPNVNATNQVGFTALPGGHRRINGTFEDLWYIGYWWSSTEEDTQYAWQWSMSNDVDFVENNGGYDKREGLSIRCVKDQ